MGRIFGRADILLPESCDMRRWSVIACDQFTARPDYWEALEREIGTAPSTLHLILPEAFLQRRDPDMAAERVHAEMRRYLAESVFREWKDSYIYVERTLPSGKLRRGLVGAFDLEAYDYARNSHSPIRATEGTIEVRLPPRVKIRQGAALELPHVMVFSNDAQGRLWPLFPALLAGQKPVYDFELCAGGGHLRGWHISGADAGRVDAALAALEADAGAGGLCYAVGDGNHSLATAKLCWEALKPSLSPQEREKHPARRSLAELVDIGDAGIIFAPIHRCIFHTDPSAYLREAKEVFAERYQERTERDNPLRFVTATGEALLPLRAESYGGLVAAAERFCGDYIARHGGTLDYIHNDAEALALGRQAGNAALLLPCPEKAALFPDVSACGPMPKKSFSIGLAEEKRYYLECRKIQFE